MEHENIEFKDQKIVDVEMKKEVEKSFIVIDDCSYYISVVIGVVKGPFLITQL